MTDERFILILENGATVRLVAHQSDESSIAAAARSMIARGASGWVAEASGPLTAGAENLVMVRSFGDVAGTFAEARQRYATRNDRAAGNQVFRR